MFLFNFLYACQTVNEGFKLKKDNTADEFLVEKKNPLVLPPNFNELPTPESANSSTKDEVESFETAIKKSASGKNDSKEIKSSSSTEEFILKNIKKDESD